MRPVGEAYQLAHQLAEKGLGFVRAPIRHRRDGVTWKHDDWLISVWPWLDGRISPGHLHDSPVDLAAALRCVRRLHDHELADGIPDLVEDWWIPDRPRVVELQGLPGDQWPPGPFTEEVRQRLADNEGRVREMFARYASLRPRLVRTTAST